jgi:hypothetical protein
MLETTDRQRIRNDEVLASYRPEGSASPLFDVGEWHWTLALLAASSSKFLKLGPQPDNDVDMSWITSRDGCDRCVRARQWRAGYC